jgi:hypothetical protein
MTNVLSYQGNANQNLNKMPPLSSLNGYGQENKQQMPVRCREERGTLTHC